MSDQNENKTHVTGLIPISLTKHEVALVDDKPAEVAIFSDSKAKDLESYALEKIEAAAPEMIPILLDGWKSAIKSGDTRAMRDMAEAFKVLQPRGQQININQNNQQLNYTKASSDGRPSIEDIIKGFDEAKFKKRRDEDIIDAEIVEPDEK